MSIDRLGLINRFMERWKVVRTEPFQSLDLTDGQWDSVWLIIPTKHEKAFGAQRGVNRMKCFLNACGLI